VSQHLLEPSRRCILDKEISRFDLFVRGGSLENVVQRR
jgi:hypothetical protein